MTAVAQRSFSGGEIAPSLHARVDQSKYAAGLKTCRNFIVMRHGGVVNRPGTYFVGEIETPSETVRLIPFVYNTDQTYVLEFGDKYIRVIKNGTQLTLTAQNITNVTNTNPGVVTYSGSDTYANGDVVYIAGVVGDIATNINNRCFKVAGVIIGSNTFQLTTLAGSNFDTTSLGSYTSGGTVAEIYLKATSFAEVDLPDFQFVQSADVITFTHPTYAPALITRAGDTDWVTSDITFGPAMSAPATVTNNGGAGTTYAWVVTAQNDETGEESLQSSATTSAAAAATLTISEVTAPAIGSYTPTVTYHVYKRQDGIYGYIGSCIKSGATIIFVDDGNIDPDITDTPPFERDIFGAADDYPACVTYYQNRRIFGNLNTQPESIFASQTGLYTNFNGNVPTLDSDPVTWTMLGRQVSSIRHLLELGKLIILTDTGEWAINGDASGLLLPTAMNPRQFSSHGSSTLRPIIVGNTILFVQARKTIVRDLAYDSSSEGYAGNDLSIFATHLFDGYTIVDMAFQQIPHSILWVVRSDGVLLGLTYVKEQEIWAWHRHDFENGTVENVCVVPEGTEDAVYLVIKRSINGSDVRYIERMTSREIDEDAIEDSIFLDSALTYDGTNEGATTLTISGGTTWVADELLTLTASVASTFPSTDVGNRYDITAADGTVIRFTVSAYTSGTVVQGFAHKTVPAGLQSIARTTWVKCVDQVTGLWHLEGEEVAVFADGFVVANPNNSAYETVTVTNGIVTLDKPYGVIHVGLPITSDIETLEIDQSVGESIAGRQKLINQVTIFTESSRGIWVGDRPPSDDDTDPLEGLTEAKIRDSETYDEPVALLTGKIEINMQAGWNNNGRVFIRQVDPVPLSVLAIVPTGYIPIPR